MKHVNFQLYMAHPDRNIWKKLTISDKYINKRGDFLSGVEKKKLC